jgi:hypothetical protein
MNSIEKLSVVSRILIGSLVLTAFTGLTLAIVTIVLPTELKEASTGGIGPPSVALEIAKASLEKEDTGDYKTANSSSLDKQTSTSEEISGKSSFKRFGDSVLATNVEQPLEPSVTQTRDKGREVEFELVFDDLGENEELILDANLFAMHANPVYGEKVQAKIPTKGSSKEGSSKNSEKVSPKGSLHQTALLSKDPTVLNGLDSRKFVVVAGREGTRVGIPADSLIFEDGTPCNAPYDAKIWEFYDFTDILLSGLTTMSDQGALQTGGMTYVELSSGGRKLNLADKAKARISFAPVYETDSEFGLYNGRLEDKQILWSKVNQSQGKQVGDPTKIRVSMFPESLEDISVTGSLLCLLNSDNWISDDTKAFGSKMQKKNFSGEGLARFPNGVSLVFDGDLDITKSETDSRGSAGRSHLEIRFEGKRLLANVPPSNAKSYNKVFLPAEGFPVPFITPASPERTAIFSYQRGEETIIDALRGEISFKSTKKSVDLSEQSFAFKDRVQRGSIGRISTSSSLFPSSEIIEVFEEGDSSVMNLIHDRITNKAEEVLSSMKSKRDQTLVLANFNQRRRGGNPNANVLSNQFSRDQIERVLSEGNDWSELHSLMEEFETIATLTGDVASAGKFRQSRKKLEGQAKTAGMPDVKQLKALQVNLAFRRDFLSPRIGWHNLDKLRNERMNGQYELATNEAQLSSSLEEANASISMGPFYFSVWPQERISLVAGPGKNSIPRGAFTSMGYFLSEDGRLFADVSKGSTGKVVSLNLREMNKENFRKKVKGFL